MSIQISITGDLASGKSSLSEALSALYDIPLFKAGEISRHTANADGMTILQANKDKAKRGFNDEAIDAAAAKIVNEAGTDGDYIIDARVGFHYAPHSLKIKLVVHPDMAAQRAYKKGREAETYETVQEAYAALHERRAAEKTNLGKRYGVDLDDLSNFDLVIDTSFILKQHTLEIVEMVLKARAEGKAVPKFWCHPGQLIPGGQTPGQCEEDRLNSMVKIMSGGNFDFLRGVEAIRTKDNDLLLEDGHHRIVAASVTSLPYIGVTLKSAKELPDMRQFLSRMYDYYEIMNYMARPYAEKTSEPTPYWGSYKKGSNDAALNSYKFEFPERVMAAANKPRAQELLPE